MRKKVTIVHKVRNRQISTMSSRVNSLEMLETSRKRADVHEKIFCYQKIGVGYVLHAT